MLPWTLELSLFSLCLYFNDPPILGGQVSSEACVPRGRRMRWLWPPVEPGGRWPGTLMMNQPPPPPGPSRPPRQFLRCCDGVWSGCSRSC